MQGAGSDSRRDSILHCDWSVLIYQQHNNRHIANHSLSNFLIQLHNNDRLMTVGTTDNVINFTTLAAAEASVIIFPDFRIRSV